MSDDKKIDNVAIDADNHVADPIPDHDFDTSQLPGGWKYKVFSVGLGKTWYASPSFQLFMIAMVCFLCPGMFNALGGLGGGGQVNSDIQVKAATALYSTFAVVGFFSGTITNRLGTRFAVAFGGLGYALYAASFLSYNHNQNDGFVIFAGAFLGVCAGLLWCGQGAIMMSYPTEKNKGKYISWFWIIFNLGAVVGSLVSFLPFLAQHRLELTYSSGSPCTKHPRQGAAGGYRQHLHRLHCSHGCWPCPCPLPLQR